MAEFVSKLAVLPYVPVEKKVFDNLAQCEHLLFDPSVKQAFLLPLFHFLQKSTLRVTLPDGALQDVQSGGGGSSSSSSYAKPFGGYKYWVMCTEGLDAINAMKKQKNEDGTPVYSSDVIARLVDRYGKVWWKIQKFEHEKIVKAMTDISRQIEVQLYMISKKVIQDKSSHEDITMLVPSVNVVAFSYLLLKKV